ncbi:MAG TPA: response regulator [Pyrinomonadaceae bacterium]|nr:response regulator [Pyrinomonadaceae bacterium]
MQGLSLPYLPVSEFPAHLFIPCGGDDDPLEDASQEQWPGLENRQARVLVVDDAPDVLEMFSMMLQLSGYDVEVAASATEALKHASSMQFDVIVSDIGMPEMNGYELARRLRQMPDYARTPMIAVTGYAMYKDQKQAMESGFNAHLSKPVNPTTLLNLIEQLRK